MDELSPWHTSSASRVADPTPNSAVVRARHFVQAESWHDALEAARQAPSADPEGHLIAAHACRRLGLLDHAERELDATPRVSDSGAELRYRVERAWLRFERGDVADGLTDARFARELLDPSDRLAHGQVMHVLGMLSAASFDIDAAVACAEELVENAAEPAWAWREAARIFERAGWRERALAAIEQALEYAIGEQVHHRRGCLLDLARVLRDEGDMDWAERVMIEASELDSDGAESQLGWAWLRYDQARYQESLAHAERARGFASSEDARIGAEVGKLRGHALAKLGAHAEAITAIEGYLDVFPMDMGSHELLDELRATDEGSAAMTA